MGRQKLITKEILKNTPNLYETDGLYGETIATAKFFSPGTGWTWYMMEYDKNTNEAFGYVEGFTEELGYFSIDDFEKMNDDFFSMPYRSFRCIERDRYFKPTKLSNINSKYVDIEYANKINKYRDYQKDWIKENKVTDKELKRLVKINPIKAFEYMEENNGINGESFVCMEEFLNDMHENKTKISIDKIFVFQLKDIKSNMYKEFQGFDSKNFEINDYHKVFEYDLDNSSYEIKDLDDIYVMLQNDVDLIPTPKEYNTRSLSVSDLILTEKAGKQNLYFVDSFDFKELSDCVDKAKSIALNNKSKQKQTSSIDRAKSVSRSNTTKNKNISKEER